jgi:hypothetical protein
MLGDVIQSDDERKRIVDNLLSELQLAESKHSERVTKVNKWRRLAQAKPEQERKTFPWDGASNLVTPITLTDTNAMTSALLAAFADLKPFFNIKALNDTFNDQADALEEYLNILVESKFHINLRSKLPDIAYDLSLLGTKFGLVTWDTDIYHFKRKGESGGIEQVSTTRHQGPAVISIRDEDFFTREYVTDLQTAPWVAFRSYLTWHELKQRESNGIYENIDLIKQDTVNALPDNLTEEKSRMGIESGQSDLYEIYECFVYEDVDGDGVPEDIKIWFEKTSGTVLKEEFNDLGVRPFVKFPYISIPNELYGVGVGWLCENTQDGCDMLLNMAINSTYASSMQMFLTRRGSGLGPKIIFRPLAQLECDSPSEDMKVIEFPNTAGSNMNLYSVLREQGDKASMTPNAFMGFPDNFARTRSTASGQMFQAQQAARTFSSIVNNMKNALSEIGMLIVFQLIRNKDLADLNMLSDEKKTLIQQVLNMKVEDIHLNFSFTVTSTDVEQTEEAQRQQILTLTQLYTQYGTQILGLVRSDIQTIAPFVQMDKSGQLAQKMMTYLGKYLEVSDQVMVGGTQLMEKVLKFFNTDRRGYLPYIKDIQAMQEMMNQQKDNQLGGSNGVLRQVGQPTPMANEQSQSIGGTQEQPSGMGSSNIPNQGTQGSGSGGVGASAVSGYTG